MSEVRFDPALAPLGIGFLGGPSLNEMTQAAKTAEQAGFTSSWMSETRIARDAVSAMTALLSATCTMRVGSSAINLFTRAPALVAATWATLAEYAPGRVVLGIGLGSGSTLAQQGLHIDHAVGRLREFIEAVRAAWAGGAPVTYSGRYVQFVGLEPELQPDPVPPVYVCAGGPQTLRLSGRLADGVVTDVFLSPTAVGRALGRVHAGAKGGFRGELAAAIVTSVADSRAAAAARLRPRFAQYLMRFPELAREMGLDPELLAFLRARAEERGIEAIHGEISDEMVAGCTACGPPSACREAIRRYRAVGVQLPILFPEPSSVHAVASQLGPSSSVRP